MAKKPKASPTPRMWVEEPPYLDADDESALDRANDAVGKAMAAEDVDLDERADLIADILGGLVGDSDAAAAAIAKEP